MQYQGPDNCQHQATIDEKTDEPAKLTVRTGWTNWAWSVIAFQVITNLRNYLRTIICINGNQNNNFRNRQHQSESLQYSVCSAVFV